MKTTVINSVAETQRKLFSRQRRRALMALAAAPFAVSQAWAQAAGGWPQRPVKWIVSQPAGAGPDILARYLAEQLARSWGQPVVV